MPMLLSLQFLPKGNNELHSFVKGYKLPWLCETDRHQPTERDCKIWDVLLRASPVKIILPFITTASVTSSKCKLQPRWTALWSNCFAQICPRGSCTCYEIFSKKPLRLLLSVAFHCNSGPREGFLCCTLVPIIRSLVWISLDRGLLTNLQA